MLPSSRMLARTITAGSLFVALVTELGAGCAQVGRTDDGDAAPRDGYVAPDARRDASHKPDGVAPDGSVQSDGTVQHDAGGCTGGCTTPPNACHVSPGTCVGTECVYSYRASGYGCSDGDACTENDECDGQGNCLGDAITCSYPHTTGGTCSGGTCINVQCEAYYDDCNDDLELDGCEQSLKTATDCGACDAPCASGTNYTASCSTGSCVRTCTSPWQNCDGNWSNGCEIPVGVANRCDAAGLNSSTGCWTAYCGSSTDTNAHNFGTYYCMECSSCHQNGTLCKWCDHTTGTWNPEATCSCGGAPPCGWADCVCAVGSDYTTCGRTDC